MKEFEMKRFDYLIPKTMDELFSLLNQYGNKAALIAGGTDIMVMIKKNEISPEVLISLKAIEGLDEIKFNGDLKIGSMVTHRLIEKSNLIRKHFTALSDAVDVLGSVQIRNVATIGGNICNAAPSCDTGPPLLVLNARLKLKSSKSERIVPIDQFFKGPGETALEPGEILTEILIPKPLPNTGSSYWKHQRRKALDLPIVGIAVLISLNKSTISRTDIFSPQNNISTILHQLEKEDLICNEIRIALGVSAPTPIRVYKAEELLRGKKLTRELIEEVAEMASKEAKPRDTIRGEAWYRREIINIYVKRMAMRSIERILSPEEVPAIRRW